MEFFATAANLAVHIRDSKKGEKAVLLLHGYMETLYIWNDFFDALKRDYRVIAIDLPGHGLSCSAPVNTIELMATVAKGVLDLCEVKQAAVVGHSLGGYVALKCCELFPETFEKMVLLNSHPYPEPESFATVREREINIINSGRLQSLAEISIPKMFHSNNLRRLDSKIREIVELCETHDPSGIVASVKGFTKRSDMSEYLKNTSTPTLAICGDSDGFISSELQLKMLEQFKNMKLVTLQECGHNVFLECPEKCLELVREFIG